METILALFTFFMIMALSNLLYFIWWFGQDEVVIGEGDRGGLYYESED